MNWYKIAQSEESFQFQNRTDIPYYDDTLSEKKMEMYDHTTGVAKQIPLKQYMKEKKGISSEVVYMSPDEYINRCLEGSYPNFLEDNKGKSGVSFEKFKDYTLKYRDNPELIQEYKEKWIGGSNPPMPYILYYNGEYSDQEGYHRALLAKQLGVKQMPVLIVNEKK
jgi:hypothetical protein